jgi:ABC-type nitrate/sulfonate/bicarbonate transport system substrate-binding protein
MKGPKLLLKILTVMLVFSLVFIFVALKEEEKEGMTHIKIGLSPYQDVSSLIVAKEMGFFAEEGLEPEIIPVAWGEAAELLIAKSVDIINMADADIVYRYAKNPDFRFSNLLYLWEANALYGQKGQDWKTFDDLKAEGMSDEAAAKSVLSQLKEKAVMIPTGTGHEGVVRHFAEYGGIDYDKDIAPYIIDMQQEEGLPAFLGGDGDIFSPGIPQMNILEQEGYTRIIRTRDLPEGSLVLHAGFGTYKEFAEENFDVLVKFQAVIYKALKFIDKNEMEGFTIISDYLNEQTAAGMTPELLKTQYWNIVEFFPLPEQAYRETIAKDGRRYWKDRWIENFRQGVDAGAVSAIPTNLEEIVIWPKVMEAYLKEYEPDLYKKLK